MCKVPAWIEPHWISIRLGAWSHTTPHYTRVSVTTLHSFEGTLGQPLDTFFWALTTSRSQILACVWSDPTSWCLELIPVSDPTSKHHTTSRLLCWMNEVCSLLYMSPLSPSLSLSPLFIHSFLWTTVPTTTPTTTITQSPIMIIPIPCTRFAYLARECSLVYDHGSKPVS